MLSTRTTEDAGIVRAGLPPLPGAMMSPFLETATFPYAIESVAHPPSAPFATGGGDAGLVRMRSGGPVGYGLVLDDGLGDRLTSARPP